MFAILFSLLLFIRSESLITFLNFSATLFFGLLMLIPLHAEKMGFLDYIYAPLLFFVKSVLVKSEYNLEFKNNKGSNKTLKIVEVVFGILISLILLLVVLPLLSSANPFFQKIVIDFWKLFDFENLH